MNSRAKGKRGELEAVHIFRDYGWPNARRTSDGRAQSARGDLAGGPDGCHIEIKRVQRLNITKALSQAVTEAKAADVPIVVHRPNDHAWMATLPLEDLLPLLKLRDSA